MAVLAVMLPSPLLLRLAEEKMIETGPTGPEAPATVGLDFERLSITSGPRLLDAYLVHAAPDCQPRVALLVFHGVGETISNRVNGQCTYARTLPRVAVAARVRAVTAAFSSGRESAQYHIIGVFPHFLIHLLPDQWDNVQNVKRVHSRLLVTSQ